LEGKKPAQQGHGDRGGEGLSKAWEGATRALCKKAVGVKSHLSVKGGIKKKGVEVGRGKRSSGKPRTVVLLLSAPETWKKLRRKKKKDVGEKHFPGQTAG